MLCATPGCSRLWCWRWSTNGWLACNCPSPHTISHVGVLVCRSHSFLTLVCTAPSSLPHFPLPLHSHSHSSLIPHTHTVHVPQGDSSPPLPTPRVIQHLGTKAQRHPHKLLGVAGTLAKRGSSYVQPRLEVVASKSWRKHTQHTSAFADAPSRRVAVACAGLHNMHHTL